MIALKLSLVAVQVLISIYWAGELSKNNPAARLFLERLETNYQAFSKKIGSESVNKNLTILRTIYGWIALVSVIGIAIVSQVYEKVPVVLGAPLGLAFVISITFFSAIAWHAEKKRNLGFHYGFIYLMWIFSLSTLAELWPEKFTSGPGDVTLFAALIAAAASVPLFYVVMVAFSSAITFLSTVVARVPIAVAGLADSIAPEKPFFGLTVVVFVAVSFFLVWL